MERHQDQFLSTFEYHWRINIIVSQANVFWSSGCAHRCVNLRLSTTDWMPLKRWWRCKKWPRKPQTPWRKCQIWRDCWAGGSLQFLRRCMQVWEFKTDLSSLEKLFDPSRAPSFSAQADVGVCEFWLMLPVWKFNRRWVYSFCCIVVTVLSGVVVGKNHSLYV